MTKKRVSLIVHSASELITVSGGSPRIGRKLADIGIINDGAFAVSEGRFVAVDSTDRIVGSYTSDNTVSAKGKAVMPGFVDPHTHLVFGGERSKEFEMRLSGASYEEIMASGGGILSSVRMTREATTDQLIESAKMRLKNMIAHGTTSVEVKSGYGLDVETEVRMLKVAGKVAEELGITYKRTFLGAHAIPADTNRTEYIDLVKGEMLDTCRPHADYIDVFCDRGVFTNEETTEIAQSANMEIRLHVDELANTGGAKLASELNVVSADHLIQASDDGFKALADSGTVATFLPGTSFYLGKPFAKARKAIESGCIVALATDRNPGSCTIESMQFIIGLACKFLKMTPKEAIVASTINSAYALGIANRVGSIEVGKQADFIVLNDSSYRMIPYEFTQNHVGSVYIKGKEIT